MIVLLAFLFLALLLGLSSGSRVSAQPLLLVVAAAAMAAVYYLLPALM